MKKPIAFVVMSALALTFLASCGDDNKSSELSSDCAINAIVLGNLSRIYHTYLDNGKDTSYSITVPGAAYPLHIDQINRRIFNSDSLPVGTAVNKVYFTTFSADGIVSYRLEKILCIPLKTRSTSLHREFSRYLLRTVREAVHTP